MFIIHSECGGEMVEVKYTPDPDGDEPVVSEYKPRYVCLKCGKEMDKESAERVKHPELAINGNNN